MKAIDITNKKYGTLTAISYSYKDKKGNHIWIFKCDCGKLKKMRKCRVMVGDAKTCGYMSNHPLLQKHWKLSEETKDKFKLFKNAWKGDRVGYRGLHLWVESILGKPHYCDECGNTKLSHRHYHWANVSGNYKRITTDWRRLCAKCHKAFDKKPS